MIKMKVLKDASEVVEYDNPNIPIYVKAGRLSYYTQMQMLCHWHDDIELIKVTKGHMEYYVNGVKLRLTAGEGLFINSRQLHYGFSADGSDCEYICILFHPQLLFSNIEIWTAYIEPVISCKHIYHHHFTDDGQTGSRVLALMDTVFTAGENQDEGFLLRMLGGFYTLWAEIFALSRPLVEQESLTINKDIEIQKRMVDYIHYNFSTKITLADIARAGNVCRSKCCQIFKQQLNKSPIEFLNAYRLEISMQLLRESTMNITEIAFACGFSNPSYFAEIFLKYKGCTPSQFREI